MNRKTWFFFLTLAVALGVVLLDRWSKTWVLGHMPLYTELDLIPALFPYFRLAHSANTGIAFGLFQNGAALFTIIPAIAAAAIAAYAFQAGDQSALLSVSLGMMLGGALGNLWDRIAYGAVVDFLSVRISDSLIWPTFNIADSFIVIGTGLLVLHFLLDERKAQGKIEQSGENITSPS
ncbi:MAG TPA: signal peptidase II [Anaerolineae bacterium]|nr:signal peptidase II [Anaerolineae bacterium]